MTGHFAALESPAQNVSSFKENRHVERHLPNPSAPKNSPKMKTLLRTNSLNLPSNLQIRQAYSPKGREKRGDRKRQKKALCLTLEK